MVSYLVSIISIKIYYNITKEKLSAKDDYIEAINEIEQNIEDIKNHLVDDNMVVKKGTDGITVKLFPQ